MGDNAQALVKESGMALFGVQKTLGDDAEKKVLVFDDAYCQELARKAEPDLYLHFCSRSERPRGQARFMGSPSRGVAGVGRKRSKKRKRWVGEAEVCAQMWVATPSAKRIQVHRVRRRLQRWDELVRRVRSKRQKMWVGQASR